MHNKSKKDAKNSIEFFHILFYIGNEPKSGLARDLGDCLQSRNVPFGTSGDPRSEDCRPIFAVRFRTSVKLSCEVQDGSFIFGNGHFIVVLKSGMKMIGKEYPSREAISEIEAGFSLKR